MKLQQQLHAVLVACALGVPLVGCGSGSGDDASANEVSTEKAVTALVQTSTGSNLAGAEISILGQSFVTDASGNAQFNVKIPQSAKTVVVSFKKTAIRNK